MTSTTAPAAANAISLRARVPERLLVPCLIVAGGVLRVVLALRAGIIEHDGAYYTALAAAALRGDRAHALSPMWPPFYPWLIALAAWPLARTGSLRPETLELAARGVSIIAGLVTSWLLYRWVRRIAGARTAVIALALAAFHPRLIQYSASALTEMTFTAALCAGLLLLTPRPEGESRSREGLAGAAFGIAYLARPEGVLLGAAAWLGRMFDRTHPSRRFGLSFWLGAALLIVPWVAFVEVETGHLSLGEKGAYNFWREYRTEYRARFGDPPGIAERAFESPELTAGTPAPHIDALGLIRAEPGAIAAHTARHLARIVFESLPLACYPAYFVFALLGIPRLRRRELWPLAALLIAFPVMYAPFTEDRRFFVPAVPFVLVLTALGIERAAGWLVAPERRARLANAVTAALAVTGAGYALIHPLMESAPEHRAAGVWLRQAWPSLCEQARGDTTSARAAVARRSCRPPVVMSRKTWVAFYSCGLIAELPDGGLDSVIARARRKHADVLVMDARWAAPNRPELARLLDSRSPPRGLTVLHEIDSPMRLVLYDLRRAR